MTPTPTIAPTVSYFPDRDLGQVKYAGDAGDLVNQLIQFQHGPIGEHGINGIQNEDLLGLLAVRVRTLDQRFPCRENGLALQHIEEALFWLEHRTKLRREQGVEGQNSAHAS